MSPRARLAAILLTPIIAGGTAFFAYAQGGPGIAPPVTVTGKVISVASSSTNLQSFLWILDDKARTVTLCFSTASPETGPQYDFGCRTRPLNDKESP